MFYSCPTTERHVKTPRKREAMSERKRVRDRWRENNMSQRKNNLDRERQRGTERRNNRGKKLETERQLALWGTVDG